MRKATLVLAAVILAPSAAFAAGTNTISSVEVTARGGGADVRIRGSRPPSFTTFSLVDPPRFVVDISEAMLEGATRKVGGVGPVREVTTIGFGEGEHATARVTVTFTRDVDPPDVVVNGDELVVRVPPAPGEAVATAPAAPPPTTAAEPAAAAVATAGAQAAADARAAADAKAASEAKAMAEARAAEEARAAAQAQAARDALAAAEAKAAADAKAASEARAVADARAAEEARAAAQAQAARDAQMAAEARAAADAKAAADARAAADAKAAAQARAAEPAPRPSPARPEPPRPEPVAAPVPVAAPAPAAQAAPARPNQVESVGFRQTPAGSSVFVRLRSAPRFSVSEPRDGVVRVEFPDTRVPQRNDLKPLDTSFFPSAVARVTPSRQGKAYVVEVQLRERVSWSQRVDGETFSLDFDRPAQPGK